MADQPLQPKRRVPYPPEGKSSAKNLVPLRCPQPDHDKRSGFPMKFGISEQKDKDLEKRLLHNMRLSDIERMAEEASYVPVRTSSEAKSSKISDKLLKAKSAAEGDDMSLITSMAGRLRAAEQQVAALKEEIKKRDTVISELRSTHSAVVGEVTEERVPAASKGTEADAAMLKEHNGKLRELLRRADQDNKLLQHENAELKRFLRDYGMEWVGPESEKVSPGGENKDDAAKSKDVLKEGMWNPAVAAGEPEGSELNDESGVETLGTPFDAARILHCVKQLNVLANEGEKEIEVGPDGIRRLKQKCLVRYIFYRNGIFARGGPLRPYKLEESKVLVRDLMDGYFPWELKEEYPEGVPLRVEMRLDEAFRAGVGGAGGAGWKGDPADCKGGFRAFGGPGMALGNNGGAGEAVQGLAQVGAGEVWRPPAGKSLGDTLFRKLPSHVVKNGNVIQIKQDIMHKVQGKAGDRAAGAVQVVEVPPQAEGALAGGRAAGGGEGEGPKTVIRLKTPDGGKVLEVEMRYSATVAQLKAVAHKSWGGAGKVRLISAMPRRELNDEGMTMEEAGLVPNAMLMMACE